MQQPLSVLTMGFSPAAAVTTWRLSASKQFQCYTYWPVDSVKFQSEVFGAEHVYKPQYFDLKNPATLTDISSKSFAIVILVVPTIKDVVRMCRRLQPVLSKSSLILVDVSGGIAPLQRLVRSNLGTNYQVCGMICDIDAECINKSEKEWTIQHRKLLPNSSHALQSNQATVTLEPSTALAKVVNLVETALSSAGLTATHSKTSSSFGELQWQRTIGVVAFEVLTVALDIPEPEKLAESLIAKPIIEGLVAELNMVANASGIKGLPSKSQLTSRGPNLARKAPASFHTPNASRCYYDVSKQIPIALDFLVLLPILLSDELPKGGATPYLESLYAYMSRVLDLNSDDSKSSLFSRTNWGKNGLSKNLDDRESEINALEKKCKADLSELKIQQQQHVDKAAELEKLTADINERGEKLRLREDHVLDLERRLVHKDRFLKQREYELMHREHAIVQRERELSIPINGNTIVPETNGENGHTYSDGDDARNPDNNSPPPPVPMTPGGTVYSRFDPRAPPIINAPIHQQPNNNGNAQQSLMPPSMSKRNSAVPPQNYPENAQSGFTSYGQYNGAGNTMSNRQQMRLPVPSNSIPMNMYQIPSQNISPTHSQSTQAGAHNRRRQTRHFSSDESYITANGGRRRQNINSFYQNSGASSQSALFSQNFELDSVIGSATDRYHFVSRARNKPNDTKLSSVEDIMQGKRKFLHGAKCRTNIGQNGNISSSASTYEYRNSLHNMPIDSIGPPYTEVSRPFTPGDLSGSMSSSARKSYVGTRSLLPNSVVPNTSVDFGGFNFGDSLDPANSGISGGSSGSNDPSSTGSHETPIRGISRTPPTPQGTMDALTLQVDRKWNQSVTLPSCNIPQT